MTGAILIRSKVIFGSIDNVCVTGCVVGGISAVAPEFPQFSCQPPPKCYRCDVSITVYIFIITPPSQLLCLCTGPHQLLLQTASGEDKEEISCRRIVFSFHSDKNVTIYSPSPSYLKTRGLGGILRKCLAQEADVPRLEVYIFLFSWSCFKLIKVHLGASSRAVSNIEIKLQERKTY